MVETKLLAIIFGIISFVQLSWEQRTGALHISNFIQMEKDFLARTTNQMNHYRQKSDWSSLTNSERSAATTTFRPTSVYSWLSQEDPNKLKTNKDQVTSSIPLRVRSRINENFKIEARGVKNYYNDEELAEVCASKSTIYNVPKVFDWLTRNMYVNVTYETVGTLKNVRPIWYDLRFYMYTVGKSEECHTTDLKTWRPYLECTLLRNQRMEYLIPKYPLHQQAYVFRFTSKMDESPYIKDKTYRPRFDWMVYWDGADFK